MSTKNVFVSRVVSREQPKSNQPKNSGPPKRKRGKKGGKKKGKGKGKNGENSKGDKVKISKAVCSITDPFCPAARGSKWPDGLGTSTISYQVKGNASVSTTTNGRAFFAFTPNYPYCYSSNSTGTPATFSGSTWTTSSFSEIDSSIASALDEVRIVSAGFILRPTVSMSNAQGYFIISEAPNIYVSMGVTTGDMSYPRSIMKSLTAGSEFSFIATRTGPLANTFNGLSSASNPENFGWNGCIVELIGGPTSGTASFIVEMIINIEGTVATDNYISKFATKSPPTSNQIVKASSQTINSTGTFIEGGVAAVEKAVANAASTAVNSMWKEADSLLNEGLAWLF